MTMRIEEDLLGGKELPADALYGIQSARARENFALGGRRTDMRLIRAVGIVRNAAALADIHTGAGRPGVYEAVAAACDKVLTGDADDMFIVDALQGGAGTSSHMNVNEVLANTALLLLGRRPGDYGAVHPLDDVNRGQSTNDVYPTALRIAAIECLRVLSEECASLQQALQEKENAFDDIAKLGRTELMDAVPVTLGGEFGAYAQAVARDRWRLYKIEERLRQVNLGGTAVGLGDNVDRAWRFRALEELRRITGIGLALAEYPMDITKNNDVFVEVSGLLKALAVNLMKTAGDLRLMNSGPHGGLGEIRLAALQAGSTVMPGKINPVIPEMVMQVAMRIMAGDQAICTAAAHGEFELNAFLPLIADTLLDGLSLAARAVALFREKCILVLEPDRERCRELLEKSHAFAASFAPLLGYDTVSGIIKKHGGNAAAAEKELQCAAAAAKRLGKHRSAANTT
jgi:aspartate ammonia-lyase